MTLLIEDILTQERSRTAVEVSSKKKLLEQLANVVADEISDTTPDEVFDRLLERERLGSTGLGDGIAIPHCRLKHCQQVIGVLFCLNQSVDYDALDKQPVDLVFALIVPEEATDDHLQILALLATNFSQSGFCQRLRDASDDQSLFQQVCQSA